MRVWLLEETPDWEQATRHGIYTSPEAAWADLHELLEGVYRQDRFEVEVVQPTASDGDLPAHLDFVKGTNDRLTLTGVYVKGTGDPRLSTKEQRQFQEVAALACREASQKHDFVKTENIRWNIHRPHEGLLTAHYSYNR